MVSWVPMVSMVPRVSMVSMVPMVSLGEVDVLHLLCAEARFQGVQIHRIEPIGRGKPVAVNGEQRRQLVLLRPDVFKQQEFGQVRAPPGGFPNGPLCSSNLFALQKGRKIWKIQQFQ